MDMSHEQRWERCLTCAIRTATALGWRLDEHPVAARTCDPLTRNRCAEESTRLAELGAAPE